MQKLSPVGGGMSKHRKKGSVPNSKHFTGKKGGKRGRKQKKSRKEKRLNRGTHVNKYADEAQNSEDE